MLGFQAKSAIVGTVAALAMGCGSSQPATETPATAAPAASAAAAPGAEHHGEEHPDMSPSLRAFHDVLAPLWHAPEGAERTTATCDGTAKLRAQADAIVSAEVPLAARADESLWKSDATALTASIDVLAKACAEDGRPRFGASFGAVHESFHKLLARSSPGEAQLASPTRAMRELSSGGATSPP